MKVIHKFFVIALLLSLIFSISAVAAQENMTFEQSNTGEVSEETLSVPSEENQEVSAVEDDSSVNDAEDQNENLQVSFEDQLTESSFGTFSEIQTQINNAKSGDTIYLDGKTYISDNKRTINIYNKNLKIVGGTQSNPNLYATFDALDLSSIFYIYGGYGRNDKFSVVFDSIKFTNSKNGAIDAKCNLNITNCYFINNTGSSSALDFHDSNFEDYYYYDYYYYYDDFSTYNLNVVDSYFINSITTTYGGAIDIRESNKIDYLYYDVQNGYGNKTLKNCIFENNSGSYGGAIYIGYGANIQNCTFISNSASRFGGAIYSDFNYNFNHNVNLINDSKFISNSAVEGGAIYGQSLNITNSEFISNTASFYGGALNIRGYNTPVIKNNEFTNNYAPYYNSHSMFITSSSNKINIDFEENIVNSDKTEIYFDKGVNGLYVYILDNTTVQFCEGRIKIYALVTDDEGNKISVRDFIFLVGDEEFATKIVDSVAEIEYDANLSDTGKVVTEKTAGPRDKIYNGTLDVIPFSIVFDFENYTGAMGSAIKVPVYVNDASGHPYDTTIRAFYESYEKELQTYNGIAHVLISLPFEKTSFELGVLCDGVLKTRWIHVMDPHDDIAIQIDMTQNEKGYIGRTVTVPVFVHDGKGNALIGDINVTYDGKTRSIPLIDGQADILISLPVYETSFDLTVSFKGTSKICTVDVVDPISEIEANVNLPHNLTGNVGGTITVPVSVVDGEGKALTGDITITYNDQEIVRSLNDEGKCDIVISLPLHETSFELDVNYRGNVKSCLIDVIDPNKPTHIVINVNETFIGMPGKSITVPVSVVDGEGNPLSGTIFVEYNDYEKTETLVNGQANVVIGLPLTETSFELAISYNGHTEICLINVVDTKPHVNAVINLPGSKTEYIGKTIIIPVHVTDDDGNHLQGDVVVYYNGQETTKTLVNGHTNIVISSQLHPTSFEVTVAYQDKQAHCFVEVIDPNPSDEVIITLPQKESGHVNKTIVVPVSVFDGNRHPLKGTISIYYLGHERTETLHNGLSDIVILLPNTPMTFNLTVAYGETEQVCEITVKEASDIGESNDTTVVIEVEEDITGQIGKTITIPISIHDGKGNGLNGQFLALYNNNERQVTLKNGKANFVLTLPSTPATFDLTILYEEEWVKTTKIIVVDPNNPMGDLTDVVSNGSSVVIPFPKDANGNVIITIGGKNYTGTIINGQVIINITDLVDGEYDGTVIYSGDGNYSESEKIVTIIIKDSTVTDSNHPLANITDTQTKGDGTIEIPFPKDATGNVIVTINGKNYTGTIVDGKVVLDIKDLPAGNYTSIVYYSGDKNYTNSTKTIVIIKDATAVSPDNPMGDTTKAESNDGSINIPFPSDASGKVVVNIDGKYYTGNVVDGKVVLDVKDLPNGNYNANVYYLGGGNYSSSTRTIMLVIKETTNNQQNIPAKKPAVAKKASKITAKKKTFKKALKVKKYSITLKSGKTPIKKVQLTIKIGKKTYKAKTNAKGKATFKIKKLTKKGKYNAVIKFKGDKTYKATTKKVKITIK